MRSRTRAVLARLLQSVAVGGVFVSAAGAGLVMHADVPATRRLIVAITNKALSGLFQGHLVIGELQHLSLGRSGHVHVARAEVFDPEGQRVIVAQGIDVRIDLERLVRSLAAGRTPEIALQDARIDDVEARVDRDAHGLLGIERAFLSPPVPVPPPSAEAVPKAAPAVTESVRLSIPGAYVRHAWVHGNVLPPRLDAEAEAVRGRLFILDNRLKLDVDEARVTARSPRAPGQVGDLHGAARGALTVMVTTAAGEDDGVVMHWDLEGEGAGIPLSAHLGLDHDRLEAAVDIQTVSPDVVRRAFPALPLSRPVELHATAKGTLPDLVITTRGRVGDAELTGVGALGLGDRQPFRFDAELTRLDASAFSGPASDVSARVHVEGAILGGAPAGTFTVATREGTLAAQRAPAITAEGHFDGRRVDATFRTREPGVELEGKAELGIPEETLTFDVRARSGDLRALARAPGILAGSATARATGTIALANATIAAHVTVEGAAVAHGPASAGTVHAEARVAGPLADPVIDVTARAKLVRLASPGGGDAAGGEKKKETLTYPSATARARIVLSPAPRITSAEVTVEGEKGAASLTASAREILIGSGGIDVRGGRVEGLGAPIELDAQLANGGVSVRARAASVDVQRLATMTGIQQLRLLPEGSRATLDIDVKSTQSRADGHFDVAIAGAKDGSAAELHGVIRGRHVSARGRVAVGAIGWLEMQRAEIELPGAPSLASFERATGAIDLRGEIDLSRGAALFAGESIEQIEGMAVLSARLERGDVRNLPTVYTTVRTRGLDVILNDEGHSTHIGGIDGAIHVGYDGASDETETSLLTWDESGVLGSVDLKARVPLVGWATGKRVLDRAALGALGVAGVLDIPRRVVGELPGIFARPDLRGSIAARAELGGSVAHPVTQLVARADNLRTKKAERGTGGRFAPVSAVLDARWDGNDLVAALRVDEDERVAANRKNAKERDTGHVRALVLGQLSAADLLAGGPVAWNASAEVDIADLELGPLPLPNNARGALSGHFKLRDMSGSPLLEAQGHVEDLVFSGVRVTRGEFKLDAKNGALEASARVQQEDGGSGDVKVASSALAWRGTSVGWDATRSTRVEYTLNGARLSILRPLVRGTIPEIDGRLDGSGRATFDAESQVFEGGLALSDGRLYVTTVGEEITGVSAVARFEKNGIFRIQDARGKIGEGVIQGSVTGRMKGLVLESAEGVVVVPTKNGVPLSSEGATFAEATGQLEVSAKFIGKTNTLLVTAAVPRSTITLPDRGTQTLQSLEPDASIAIGLRQADGSLQAPPERPGLGRRMRAAMAASEDEPASAVPERVARVTVALGKDVDLEGRGLRLSLGGQAVLEVTDEVAVQGQLTLRSGGTIDVQGRKFIVDRGTVTFLEGADPEDPIVVAAAYWDAPDRTRVWVEFNGLLKTGQLTLRSEPAYSKSEILSVLLFGRADPNQARAGDARPSGAQEATALGTGIASSGLNRALGELDEDFELEQDRTSANRVRTKLGYRLRRNLKVQLGYASGFSQREPDTTYLFVEWQFVPKWSVLGTRGDRGTSILDLLFQHRY